VEAGAAGAAVQAWWAVAPAFSTLSPTVVTDSLVLCDAISACHDTPVKIEVRAVGLKEMREKRALSYSSALAKP